MSVFATIFLAIQFAAPHLPNKQVETFANVIDQRSVVADVDPLIVVSIITHESYWNERVISYDGHDYGLMQVRAKHFGGKKNDLLVGTYNILVGTHIIKVAKSFCRKHLQREPETEEWLACYQGSCGSKEAFCKPTKLTKQFEDYRICLAKDVSERKLNAPLGASAKPLKSECGKIFGR